MGPDPGARQLAATLIRRHFEGSVTVEALLDTLRGSDDPLVLAAIDVIVHEPRRGFAGVSERHWTRLYWPAVTRILHELDRGVDGVAPPRPLYPPPSIWRVIGIFVLFLWVVAIAGEHLVKLWRDSRGTVVLSTWGFLRHAAVGALFVVLSVAVFRRFLYRLRRVWQPPWWFGEGPA